MYGAYLDCIYVPVRVVLTGLGCAGLNGLCVQAQTHSGACSQCELIQSVRLQAFHCVRTSRIEGHVILGDRDKINTRVVAFYGTAPRKIAKKSHSFLSFYVKHNSATRDALIDQNQTIFSLIGHER